MGFLCALVEEHAGATAIESKLEQWGDANGLASLRSPPWRLWYDRADATLSLHHTGSHTIVLQGDVLGSSSRDSLARTLVADHEDALSALGACSFVVWDESAKTLTLSCDTMAIRPLQYVRLDHGLAASTHLPWLLEALDLERSLHHESLHQFLAVSAIPSPSTLFRNIKRLKPAETLRVEASLRSDSRLRVSSSKAPTPKDLLALARELPHRIEEAVDEAIHGAPESRFLLSGGVDTAILAASARRRGRPVKTVTLGFPQWPRLDERKEARRTAAYLGTEHEELELSTDVLEALPRLTAHSGCPIANPAALMSLELFRQMPEERIVCGDGGNELLGGLYRYHQLQDFMLSGRGPSTSKKTTLMRSVWYRLRRTPVDSLVQRSARAYFNARRLLHRHNKTSDSASAIEFFLSLEASWSDDLLRSLYTDAMRDSLGKADPLKFYRKLFEGLPSDQGLLQNVITARVQAFIPHNVMAYLMPAASLHGARPVFPFLEPKALAFMTEIPYTLSYGRGFRYLARRVYAGTHLPHALFRRAQRGFAFPVEALFKTIPGREMLHDFLGRSALEAEGILPPSTLSTLLSRFERARVDEATLPGHSPSLATTLWMFLALEVWWREFRPTALVDG